ncbi:hypothetical protein A2690_01655 [Candidatus Roizmanbacteria bacterium RIFCSPHIGHO2_01_FULL_39_12b]|uniref:NYN domain-containing protein n=1 Tax=Candidatus Roizmanbacteria bacterium RIFCSPHIGHO2_01_FULL_39_12b TaxID=1802030 RepID=A0A1F7GB82_9BACT|nr:MAG: hypothetical protein A2690_01655 [Candidatus Roizmanbacteria bacterium RIFCSPHIGHO2_01_FULL_39_12b]OGK46127.1 MAG: hypothetical protein A3B46_02900 [Candidatus Roizmanbacteria bacterium RIFCSPLOWO2_01_FULL_39_19]
MQSETILLIDGENFLHKVKDVLKENKIDPKQADISRIDINFLLVKSLGQYRISRKIFYAAKLHFNEETKKKSMELILQQRYLKTQLIKQGFEFLIGGNVRSQKVGNEIIFREKGVDVKIAVDMVSLAADKRAKTIILCSSDSDLQPAINEAKKRNVEIVYLGFEMQPNKGLSYTTNRTILFRNSEIQEAVVNGEKD